MNNGKKSLFKRLTSTRHWYTRLIQWPFIILFYAVGGLAVLALLLIVATLWPLYDFEK